MFFDFLSQSDDVLVQDGVPAALLKRPPTFLEEVKALIGESDFGLWLLNHAEDKGWNFGFSMALNQDYVLEAETQTIVLSTQGESVAAAAKSTRLRAIIIAAGFKALRELYHQTREEKVSYDLPSLLLKKRCEVADVNVAAILGAWELREAGIFEPWRAVIASDIGDMAILFSEAMSTDEDEDLSPTERHQHITMGLGRAFRQWFSDQSRVDETDHNHLEALDVALKGKDIDAVIGKTRLGRVAILRIGCMVDKSSYLAGLVDDILSGPIYTGLNDPINQAHFMHLMQDLKVTRINGVPFGDMELASKIFPEGQA